MDSLATVLTARLAEIQEAGRYRRLEALLTPQGTDIRIAGRGYLNFSSNDYLGMANHPELRRAMLEGVKRYGVGSGAAALLSGRSTAHVDLERALAAYMHRDRALLFSSGYLANLGLVGALVGRHDAVFQDRLNHASLIDAVRLSRAHAVRYSHSDVAGLAEQLYVKGFQRKWVLTDCVFSMDGDLAPLDRIADICRISGAVLIGDDAHGFGVLGGGRGSPAHFSLSQQDMPAVVVTFGKALGTAGAAVVGTELVIETLIQSARTFIFDTAPPPALAVATCRALELLSSESWRYEKLYRNIAYFRRRAMGEGFGLLDSETPIQPILIGDDRAAVSAAARLADRGIYVRAVRPPTVPAGTARLRIGLSAEHDEAQIDELISALGESLQKDTI